MNGSTRVYLSKPLAAREQARRRTLLLSIGVLIVLSTSPVFGHHLMRGGETLLGGTDRIGELCLVALHILLAPVHEVFHVLLVAGVVYAAWDRLRAWQRLRESLRSFVITRADPGDQIWVAARAAGVKPELIRVIEDSPNPAFTAGWRKPSIYLSRQLATSLGAAELAALMAHEGAHAARRDPLRLSLFRFLGRTLFWLPAMSRLAADMADEAEIDADDHAAGTSPLVLAAAIVAVAQWSRDRQVWAPGISGAVGFVHGDMIERRVLRLAGEDVPLATHVTRRSIITAGAALALVLTSGVLMAHPLPSGTNGQMQHGARDAADCGEHLGPAILHLFCPEFEMARATQPCPHYAGKPVT